MSPTRFLAPQSVRRLIWVALLTLLAVVSTAFYLLWDEMAKVPVAAIPAAIALTALSFWAVGQYDVIWHRTVGRTPWALPTHLIGMVAVAIAQTIGASAITATLVRRYAMPEMSVIDVGKISAGVALSFSGCWAFLALGALALLPDTGLFAAPAPALVACLMLGVAVALIRLARQRLVLIPDALRLIWWTALDLTAAAAALYLLMPNSMSLDFTAFWAVFVLAVGAGILSHMPGGLGAFDLVIVACLPMVPVSETLASLLAFRMIYYTLPFALAALWLTGRRDGVIAPRTMVVPPPGAPAAWGLAAQSGTLLSTRYGALHVARLLGALVALGDPLGTRLGTLPAIAHRYSLSSAVYKCTPRLATRLRQRGWYVQRIAQEALIAPANWSPEGRGRRVLRRKLRQAEAAGVSIHHVAGPLPLQQMARIANEWADARQGELGFSTGRYTAAYVAQQEVFLIVQGDRICGFVTFNRGPYDWALDLIRYDQTLPSGAVHLAVCSAIGAAAAANARQVSLGAVPCDNGILARLGAARTGLRQFKQGFAPHWSPRYHAAPNWLVCQWTLLVIAWRIQRLPQRIGHLLAARFPLSRPRGLLSRLSFRTSHATSAAPELIRARTPDQPQKQRTDPDDKPAVNAA